MALLSCVDWPPLYGPLFGSFGGFLQTVGLAVYSDDFGVMDEAVDHRNDTGCVGENLVPFGEVSVGCDQGAFGLVAAADQLEEKVGMAVGVRQVSNFIYDQKRWGSVMRQPPT
jgi:hypothetical protein